MLKLHIQDDEGKTTVVPVIRDEITIGRKEGNTIRLTERNVSRHHARLTRKNNNIILEDVDARYGTRVNGMKLTGAMELLPNDVIQIGDYLLALHADHVSDDIATQDMPTATDLSISRRTDTVPPMGSPDEAMTTAMIAVGELEQSIAEEILDISSEDQAQLVVISHNMTGHEARITHTPFIVGRTEDNDFALDHRSISRNHISITYEGGSYSVRDLGSANGVKINGDSYKRSDLHPGDDIEMGHIKLRFVAPGEVFVAGDYGLDASDLLVAEFAPSRAGKFALLGILLAAVVAASLWGFHFSKAPKITRTVSDTPVLAKTVATNSEDQSANKAFPAPGEAKDNALAPEKVVERTVDGPLGDKDDGGKAAAEAVALRAAAVKETELTAAADKVAADRAAADKKAAREASVAKAAADKKTARIAKEKAAAGVLSKIEQAKAEKEAKKKKAVKMVKRGDAMLAQSRFKRAADTYRRALRLDRRNKAAKPGLRAARKALKKEAKAKAAVEREKVLAAKKEAKVTKLEQAKQYAAEAKAAKRASNLPLATKLYRKCLILASCQADLAVILMAIGKRCSAVTQMRRYVRRRPGSGKAVQFRRLIEQFEPVCNN